MTAKVLVTIIWAAVLIGVNKLLSGVEWAQFVAIFVLAAAYALLIDKVNKRQRPVRGGEN